MMWFMDHPWMTFILAFIALLVVEESVSNICKAVMEISITATGEMLVYGDVIRYGRPLFNSVEDERFPIPVIIPLCLSGDNIHEITWDNFGKQVRLYLYERRVST